MICYGRKPTLKSGNTEDFKTKCLTRDILPASFFNTDPGCTCILNFECRYPVHTNNCPAGEAAGTVLTFIAKNEMDTARTKFFN